MTFVDLRPWNIRPVEVLIEGRWRSGDLEAYRRDAAGWAGFVRHSDGPGALNYLGWFRQDCLRPSGTQLKIVSQPRTPEILDDDASESS